MFITTGEELKYICNEHFCRNQMLGGQLGLWMSHQNRAAVVRYLLLGGFLFYILIACVVFKNGKGCTICNS